MVPRVVLASGSPRRAEILRLLGVEFEVEPADIEELTEGDPAQVVAENARRKALAVAASRGGATVIGGDTEVVLDGRVYGQPRDEAEAEVFLSELSGRTHLVISAVCVASPKGVREGTCETHVTFRELGEALLRRYLRSREWRGRAGAYAIQGLGSCLVRRVEGDFSNVVGLPVPLLMELAPDLFP